MLDCYRPPKQRLTTTVYMSWASTSRRYGTGMKCERFRNELSNKMMRR